MIRVPGAHVDTTIVDDPLLGPAHVVTSARVTTMSAIDWERPTTIPTIADPAALSPGAGGALMNEIAIRAQRAGTTLRYAGRYATAALFRTLLRSFRTTASEHDFTKHFRFDAAVEVPIDFTPAPFERIGNAHGYIEVRDGIERAVVDGVSFDTGICRIVDNRAEVWFVDRLYAHVATFEGTRLVEVHPLPRCESAVIGKPFPPALVAAIAEIVDVPAPLEADARRFMTAQSIRWADLGAKAAAEDAGGFAVHAILWERLANRIPNDVPRLAQALAEALGPVVTRALIRQISRDVGLMSPSR